MLSMIDTLIENQMFLSSRAVSASDNGKAVQPTAARG